MKDEFGGVGGSEEALLLPDFTSWLYVTKNQCSVPMTQDIHGTEILNNIMEVFHLLVGWLCLTSHRQRGHLETAPPIYCPLQRTCSSINTPFQPVIEPRAVAWQSITLPLRYASSTFHL